MIRTRLVAASVVILLLANAVCRLDAAPQAKGPDAPNCVDHPLLTRMQAMHIVLCRTVDFDQFAFKTGKTTTTPVDGKRIEIKYQADTGATAPSPLAIIRNHQQALTKIGGAVQYEHQRYTTLKVSKDGKEVWVQVDTAWNRGYYLTIVEKQAMIQEVVASAELFKTGLSASGHVEVPGIFFDTGKAELKPESDAAIAEVARLLQTDATLRVFVVGHTDNVAALDLNLRLSQARAEAVVQALVGKHGIAAGRLIGRGVGPLAPVASNGAEEGRARNRRVELVRQ